METRIFKGKTGDDVSDQCRKWQLANPRVGVVEKYPIERLPLSLKPPKQFPPIVHLATVSMRVDYKLAGC